MQIYRLERFAAFRIYLRTPASPRRFPDINRSVYLLPDFFNCPENSWRTHRCAETFFSLLSILFPKVIRKPRLIGRGRSFSFGIARRGLKASVWTNSHRPRFRAQELARSAGNSIQ